MKAKELIEALEGQVSEHGDLDVFFGETYSMSPFQRSIQVAGVGLLNRPAPNGGIAILLESPSQARARKESQPEIR